MKPLPKISKSTQTDFHFFKVQEDLLLLENGQAYSYYSLLLPPFSVMVLAFTPDNQLLLTKEYRHPTKKVLLGCPGGIVDEGEDPLMAAKRELLEETGYSATHFEMMGSSYPFPGVTSQKTFYVLAKGAYFLEAPKPEDTEYIDSFLIDFKTLASFMKETELEQDANLLAALFHYHLHTTKEI